jgi:hypothetical protein
MKLFSAIACVMLFLTLGSCRHRTEILPEEDYLAFVREIITAAYSEHPDPNVFTDAFDLHAFADRISVQGDIPERQRPELDRFLKEYFQPGRRMLARVDQGADYQLVSFHMRHDTAHAIFRIYNGTVTFEEWMMLAGKNGIRIFDISDPISGMYWSDEWNMNACAYLDIRDDHFLINEKLIEINRMIGQKDFSGADSLFTWIEQATKNNLYARAMRLNLLSQSQPYDSLLSACRDFLVMFPEKTATTSFFCLQNAISHGMMPEVRQHCDELGRAIGYDPIFFLYLAWGYKAAGDPESSLRMLDSLTAYIPVQYDFHNYKLDLYYDQQDITGFIRQMEWIDSLFSASDEDIPYYEENYPDMKNRPEFKAWKQRHLQKLSSEKSAL